MVFKVNMLFFPYLMSLRMLFLEQQDYLYHNTNKRRSDVCLLFIYFNRFQIIWFVTWGIVNTAVVSNYTVIDYGRYKSAKNKNQIPDRFGEFE